MVKEVLTRSEFDARPFPYAIQIRSWMQRLGVFFSIGNYWLEQRRFSLRYMRDFGFGRRMPKLENVMENEMQLMLDSIKNGPGTKEDEVCMSLLTVRLDLPIKSPQPGMIRNYDVRLQS